MNYQNRSVQPWSFNRQAKLLLLTCLGALGLNTGNAQLLITQYYEGPSVNKWIELTNVGSTSIDLSAFSLSQFNNANAEGYKTGVAGSFTMALTGTLAAGGSYVIGNSGNTTPVGLVADKTDNSVINFNGDDSLVLWNNSAAFSTSQIVDAIGFTDLGNEGADKSFVRNSLGMGYSFDVGSEVTDFSGAWTLVALATVNSALAGTDNALGYSSLSAAAAVPEPSTYAAMLAGLLFVGVTAAIRRRRASV